MFFVPYRVPNSKRKSLKHSDMRTKKNPKADLKKRIPFFFLIGLLTALSLVYVALEWKSYDIMESFDPTQEVAEILDEEAPIFKEEKIQIKKKMPVIPDVIEEIPDDDPQEETIIKSMESNENTIISIDSIPDIDEPDLDPIPFAVIEEVPVFPGCENEADKRSCFNEMMQRHIKKNFKYPAPAVETGLQGRVYITFTIAEDGSIKDIRYRGPAKILENEALRIIKELPKMTPGKQRGRPVPVPFSIPITFKLQ